MTTYTRAYPLVYIELESNPLDAPDSGDWIDITGYVRKLSFKHGRSKAVDDCPPGGGSMVLDNRESLFDPTNTSGPYYGKLNLRRKVRVDMHIETYDGDTGIPLAEYDIPIAFGWITSWNAEWRFRYLVDTTVTWTDALGLLSNHDLPDSVWDYQIKSHVDAGKVVAWHRWGDESSSALDASGNGNHGRYVIAENGADPTSSALAPTAVVRAGHGDQIIPQVDRPGLAVGRMVSEAGQPAVAPSLGWRFPCVVMSDNTALWGTEFTVETWVRYRAAFSLSAAGLASSTTARYQWVGFWGDSPYQNSRSMGFGLTGMPACSAAYFGEFVPGTPPAQWFQLPAVGTPSGYTSVDDNQVHHVVWVVTRGTLGGLGNSVVTVYVDGVAQSPVINITDDYPIPYGRPLTIGFQHQRLYPTAAPSLDFGFGCDLGDVVVYNEALSSGDVLTNYRAGRYGNLTASADLETGDAFDQALGMVGYGLSPVAFVPAEKQVAAGKMKGRRVVDYLRDLARGVDGLLWQDREGDLRLDAEAWKRAPYTGGTVVARLYDDASFVSPEFGYTRCDFNLDDALLSNSVTVNFDGGSRTAESATSIAEHGRYEQSISTLLVDAADAEGLAQFRVLQRGTPQVEIGTVTFALDIDSFTFVQNHCDVGYRVEVTRTRPNGTKINGEYWIESVAHTIDLNRPGIDQGSPYAAVSALPGNEARGVWDITLELSPADQFTPFTLDTSELDGTDLLWY